MEKNQGKKYDFKGKKVAGVEVNFEIIEEPWHRYRLGDGSLLDVIFIANKIIRLEGEYNPDGTPVYQVQMDMVFKSNVPESVRKKDEQSKEIN
jgi:hypothetical protein